MSRTFVLVHSPIASPFIWSRVAEHLRFLGHQVLVPPLPDQDEPNEPFWRLHAGAIATALDALGPETALILAGHSGGGALLPAIRQLARRPVAAYLFVDAGIPRDGAPRAEGSFWELLEQMYARAEPYPSWTPEDLREMFPDLATGKQVAADGRPQPARYWREPIEVFAGWPDAPCGLVRFVPNPAYDAAADDARQRGWPIRELDGGHFHLLIDPAAVAGAMLALVDDLQVA